MSQTQFPIPADQRYFEDYPPGAVYEFGSISVTAEEIMDFARHYDPQYFHLDPKRAEQGPFGGLAASGWHTAAMMMRMFADHYLSSAASLGSPGVDELRWTRPVRPGDTLSLRVTTLEATPSRSKPDRGLLRILMEVLNQRREVVMSVRAMCIALRRPAAT